MAERDHIDRFLDGLEPIEGLDYEVEGIVDRIGSINRRIKRGMESTLADFGLTHGDWEVLTTLRNRGKRQRHTPGALATYLELSSGAMTTRLDRLEDAGFIRRVPDPGDRRSVEIEMTDEGRARWEAAASVQARKEAFFVGALSDAERKRLNDLLRKLMLAFEAAERPAEPAPG
jgi:DNA-binding MarR family transcriptional regulator